MNDETIRDTALAAGGRLVRLDSEAAGWAWAQPIANNPGARIVLLCLGGMVDDSWECVASQEEIAEVALLSARSVRRYMEQLEDGGHIKRHKRFDEKGHRLSDRCRLNPGKSLPANLDGRQVSPVADLAGSEGNHRPIWPVANMASGSEQGKRPSANLDGGQSDLWPDWPLGDAPETDIPRSEPAAKLTSGQIGRASSSPTENYNNPSSSKKGVAGGNDPKPKTKRKIATPAPDIFPVTDDMRAWAKSKGISVDLNFETEQFLNKHRSKGNTFVDWLSAWRTWMNNAHKWSQPAAQRAATGTTGSRFTPGSGAHTNRNTAYSENLEDVFGP